MAPAIQLLPHPRPERKPELIGKKPRSELRKEVLGRDQEPLARKIEGKESCHGVVRGSISRAA